MCLSGCLLGGVYVPCVYQAVSLVEFIYPVFIRMSPWGVLTLPCVYQDVSLVEFMYPAFIRVSPWWSLCALCLSVCILGGGRCNLYLSHGKWSYRRRLRFLRLCACSVCDCNWSSAITSHYLLIDLKIIILLITCLVPNAMCEKCGLATRLGKTVSHSTALPSKLFLLCVFVFPYQRL